MELARIKELYGIVLNEDFNGKNLLGMEKMFFFGM
jgi:hypothetical protein